MTDYRKPGVYVEETLLVNSADVGSATSTALFVGVAATGPVDRPVRCETWSDYVNNFGGFTEVVDDTGVSYTTYLPYSVYSYFQNGGRPAYIQRAVVASTGNSASLDFNDGDALTATMANKRANKVDLVATVTNKALTSNVATLTTSAVHNFQTGQSVVVAGVDATFNGTYTILSVTNNTFSYAKTNANVVSTAGAGTATVTQSVTATLTASGNHGFTVGRKVTVSGVSAPFNGVFTITAVTSTTFSYALPLATDTTGLETNVVATGTATVNPQRAFSVQANSIGAAGNRISVALALVDSVNAVYTLLVYVDGDEVERFQYVTLKTDLAGTKRLDAAVNDPYSGSTLINIYNLTSTVTPAEQISPKALTGGAEADLPSASDFPTAAIAAVDKVEGPLLVNLVGYTSDKNSPDMYIAPNTVSQQSSFPSRGDVFIINDSVRPRKKGESEATYRQAINSSLASSTGDSYVAAYTPWIIVPNPKINGATITIPPGGAVAGTMSRIDASTGVFRAPAGLIASINNAVGVDTRYSDSLLGDLNSNNINVIRPMVGSGVAIMGARTRKLYGADRYISARRTLIYIKESMRRSTQFALFENNDQRLWSQLTMTAERLLRPLWEAGGLRGDNAQEAYYIKCDASINTPAVISSGEVRMELGVALEYPAEFIVVRVTQFENGGGISAEVQPQR